MSGRVRADGRSSRFRHTSPEKDRRLSRSFGTRSTRSVRSSRRDGNNLCPPPTVLRGSFIMEAISLRPGGTATAGTFASFAMGSRPQVRALHGLHSRREGGTTDGQAFAPRRPHAISTRTDSKHAFVRLRWRITQTDSPHPPLPSLPTKGPVRNQLEKALLRGRDQIHQGLHCAVP